MEGKSLNCRILSILACGPFLFSLGISSSSTLAAGGKGTSNNLIMDQLESGQIVTEKSGNALTFQTLVRADSAKIVSAFDDLNLLPKVFKDIAFAKTYTTSDGKNLVYLKLRSLGDGVGILAEVKEGGASSFVNAKNLFASANTLGTRDALPEAGIGFEEQTLQKKGQSDRQVKLIKTLLLQGPLNRVDQLPGVTFSLNMAVGTYSLVTPDASVSPSSTYLIAKIAFGSQVVREELGDYRGFGDARLTLAQRVGVETFSNLKMDFGGF